MQESSLIDIIAVFSCTVNVSDCQLMVEGLKLLAQV